MDVTGVTDLGRQLQCLRPFVPLMRREMVGSPACVASCHMQEGHRCCLKPRTHQHTISVQLWLPHLG